MLEQFLSWIQLAPYLAAECNLATKSNFSYNQETVSLGKTFENGADLIIVIAFLW